MTHNILRKSITATLFFVAFASAFAAKTYITHDKLSALYTIDGFQVIKTMNHQDLDMYLDSVKYSGVKAIDMCALLNNYDENYYHDKALRNGNLVAPLTTNGSTFADAVQYDYWDNIIYVVRECWKRGIYVKITPLGPDVYKNVQPNKGMVRIYINLLCRLLKNEANIVWRIDQSIMGPQAAELAEEMVGAIKVHNKKQLIVFE
ncbi:MAG: DUF4038 domain-containing protein [Paludibacteraceae bacterium]|nr:DUF4038 domain-containing protein [Paludibacteraceae bacterium]